jgi:hypothetical protein
MGKEASDRRPDPVYRDGGVQVRALDGISLVIDEELLP